MSRYYQAIIGEKNEIVHKQVKRYSSSLLNREIGIRMAKCNHLITTTVGKDVGNGTSYVFPVGVYFHDTISR